MNDSERRNRSGAHQAVGDTHDAESAKFLVIREAEVRAQERMAVSMERVLEEVKGLRKDLSSTTEELNEHKLARAELDGEFRGSLKSHDDQLVSIWKQFDEKRAAWTGVIPAIIVSLISTILGSAIIGGITISVVKEQMAAISQPAPAQTTPAAQNPASGKP